MNYQLTSLKDINRQFKYIHTNLNKLYDDIERISNRDNLDIHSEQFDMRIEWRLAADQIAHLNDLLAGLGTKEECDIVFNRTNMQLEKLYHMLMHLKLSI